MTTTPTPGSQCNQSPSAGAAASGHSEDVFSVLFERSPDPMWLLDPVTSRVTACNDAAVGLMRARDRAELIGQTPIDLSPEFQADGAASGPRARELMARSRQQGGTRFEWLMRRRDATDVHVEVTSTAVPFGESVRHFIISRDITERRQAEAALSESQRVLASLADNLSEAVYRSGPDHDLIYVNRAYLNLFGFGSLEEVRKVPRERLFADPADRLRLLERLTTTGRYQSLEVKFMHRSGSPFWGLISSQAIRDPDTGRVLFHVGSIVDITARRQAEQELRQLNQSLEERVAERTAALHLANELLRDEVGERHRREKVERALFQISEAIHLAGDLEQLYPLLHDAVQQLMPARNFFITLHEPATDLHHFVYHRDEMDPPPPPRQLRTGMTAYVFRTGRPLLADRAAMLAPAGSRPGQEWSVEHGQPSAVWLGVPLVAQGRTLGVMAVQDYHDETAFGESEKRILAFIAEQTALAIARKRAEQELRESEARHRALFEATSQGVMLHDEHAIFAINPAAVRIMGYTSAEEVMGRHPVDFSAPVQAGGRPSVELAPQYIQTALTAGRVRFDWIGRRPDGRRFPMEVTLTAIELGGRRILQAVIDDITERQQRLRVEHALFRISEAIHEADNLEQLYPLLHDAVQELMPARNFYIAIHEPQDNRLSFPYYVDERDATPAPRPLGNGFTEYVMHTGQPLLANSAVAEEIRRQQRHEAQGSPAALWLGVPLTVRGRTFGAMAVQDYQDPHAYGENEQRLLMFVAEQTALAIERKRADDAFKQRHRELMALLNSLPGYAFFKDADGHYLLGNQNFCRVAGCSAEELPGRTDFDLFPPEEATRYRAVDRHLLETGETAHVGEEIVVDSGRTLLVEKTKQPVRDGSGRVVGLLCLGFDVTERRRAELELRRALEREQELGRMKSNFTSLVSHEFRTPLGIISSSAEILRDYFERLTADERAGHLDTICKHTRRMGNLMEEVLLLSRFDAGRTEFQAQPMELAGFCERVVEDVLSATGKCCSVRLLVADDLPEGRADDRLLRHILINLLVNAVKYSEPGAVVELLVDQDYQDAVFEVRDRGIGIPESDQQWVFQAFHRGSNVGQRPGTGLGLVIVKRCVDLHGGQIELESSVGRGTTMRVRIPMFEAGGLGGSGGQPQMNTDGHR